MRRWGGSEVRGPFWMQPDRSRRRGAVRWWWAFVIVALGAIGYFAVSLVQVVATGRVSQLGPVDAIVVMGAAQYDGRPSPQLAARLDEVVRLWPRGYADLIVVTGGRQPGDRFTEAEASARYLIDRDIPASAVMLENEGTSTHESLSAVAELLGADGRSSVLVVTDPFHSLRSRLIAQELGLDARVAPTRTSVVSGSTAVRLYLREAAGVAVGRLIGFDRLSEITD